jgi:hypothetical protein
VLLALVVIFYIPALGLIELALALVLGAVIGVSGADEDRLSTLAIVAGTMQTAWFFFIASPPEGMIGGQLSLATSVGLVVGGALWRGGIVQPIQLPRAIAQRRGGGRTPRVLYAT